MSTTFILDGSNLAWLGPGDGPALAPVDAIADALRTEWPGCKVITVCDASLRHRLDAADKAEHKRRATAGELVEAPADEDADAYILDAARRLGGCVVTRDLYRDRREARAGLPMLRPALIGGAVILGDPKVFPAADSDRGEPLPADALGERVAPAPLPGGDPLSPVETVADADPPDAGSEAAVDVAVDGPGAGPTQPDSGPSGDHRAVIDPPDSPPEGPRPERARPKAAAAGAGSEPRRPGRARSKTTDPDDAPEAPRPKRTRSRKPEPESPPPSPAEPEAGTGGAVVWALVLCLVVVGAAAAWLTGGDPPAPGAGDVLFVRNCKGWQLAGGEERIVFHARPHHCAISIAALGPEQYVATVAEGDAPWTEGVVHLVIADARGETRSSEATRGRRGDGEVVAERASARIAGVDPTTSTLALRVDPGGERPAIWLVRGVDGEVRRHAEHLAGIALAPGRAAALRHHCPSGCGTVHIADDVTGALDAAEVADPPPDGGPRWAGPAAFSPDGRTLAVAEAFDGARGGVTLVDVPSGERRRAPFEARERGVVTGLAWTGAGLFLGTTGALYRLTDADGVGWERVTRRPESVASTHRPAPMEQ